MAETMTYDPGTDSVTTEGNLTPEEQNSLQVGEELQQEMQMAQQAAQQQALTEQAGQLAGSPMVDPSKNPALAAMTQPPEE